MLLSTRMVTVRSATGDIIFVLISLYLQNMSYDFVVVVIITIVVDVGEFDIDGFAIVDVDVNVVVGIDFVVNDILFVQRGSFPAPHPRAKGWGVTKVPGRPSLEWEDLGSRDR